MVRFRGKPCLGRKVEGRGWWPETVCLKRVWGKTQSGTSGRRVWGQRPGQLAMANFQSEDFRMAFEDKVLTCRDCGQEFVFTAGEQEFYAEKVLP